MHSLNHYLILKPQLILILAVVLILMQNTDNKIKSNINRKLIFNTYTNTKDKNNNIDAGTSRPTGNYL